MKKLALVFLLAVVFSMAGIALACPQIDDAVDYNCNETLKITVTGDSYVTGDQDPEQTKENGGYVLDLEDLFPNASVKNMGADGYTSRQLYRHFAKYLGKKQKTTAHASRADWFIIDVGRNDYWKKVKPGYVYNQIKKLVKRVTDYYQENSYELPVFVVATMPKTKRAFQNPFIKAVNKVLKKRKNKPFKLVYFHKIKAVGKDGLHPGKKGYERIANKLHKYITGDGEKIALANRVDTDADGVYDTFEPGFNCDPTLYDTDGDTLADGVELFTYDTDPADSDSDDDGKSDGAEITAGTNPNDPNS